jgi:hypothetical protein
MKELYKFRQYLTEGKLLKEKMSLEVDDDFIELSAGSGEYDGDLNDDGTVDFSVVYDDGTEFDESNWKSILGKKHAFVKISKKIPTKVEAVADYVMITVDLEDLKKLSLAEGRLLKEEMSIEDVYKDAKRQVKDIHNIDVPMDVVKQWADNYQFPYSREEDPEDEDNYILVYDFGTEERGDFMEWLKDKRSGLAEGNLLKEMASANLELKSLAKNLFSTFKKMGAKVELSTGKVRLDKAPSGDLDEKNVWISVNDDVIELSLVGEEAAKNLPKIEATFSNFEFKDRGDSKSWNDQNVKNIAIMPGKGMSEALNENAPGYDTRKFGEALPTLESVKAAHEAKQDVEEGEGYKELKENKMDNFDLRKYLTEGKLLKV